MKDNARPTGAELAAEIDLWLDRTGTLKTHFGLTVLGRPSALDQIRKARHPLPATVARVRAALARDYLAPVEAGAAAPNTARMLTEERIVTRRRERETQLVAKGQKNAAVLAAERAAARAPKPRLSPADQIQRAWLEEPADVIRLLKREWSDLWDGVVADARRAGVRPVEHLIGIVRAGIAG